MQMFSAQETASWKRRPLATHANRDGVLSFAGLRRSPLLSVPCRRLPRRVRFTESSTARAGSPIRINRPRARHRSMPVARNARPRVGSPSPEPLNRPQSRARPTHPLLRRLPFASLLPLRHRSLHRLRPQPLRLRLPQSQLRLHLRRQSRALEFRSRPASRPIGSSSWSMPIPTARCSALRAALTC
jgi:hypothetical protein